MKNKKMTTRILTIAITVAMLFSLMPMTAFAAPLIPVAHIVGNSTPPAESAVENFTVGAVGASDYVSPAYDFWEAGRDTFFFITGDPVRESEHGTIVTVTYQGMDFDAEVIYIPRQDIAGVGGSVGAPNVPLFEVSPLVATNNGGAPIPPGFTGPTVDFQSGATYFFDAGGFVDTDDFSVVNRFSVSNLSLVGLYKDASNGEPLTTFYKMPANATRGANVAGFMARTVLNAPNIHIENIIWDGSGIDMVRQAQSSRGEYFWFISSAAANFVARDVILQNIGNRTSLPLMENLTAGNHRKNVAVNIFVAGSLGSGTEGSQRNFENLTIRNARTMAAYGVIQFNRTSGNYFYNLNVANPNADGTGIAHSTAMNTYPIKIEHRPVGTATVATPGGTFTGNQIASAQRDFVFAGTLTMPNSANSAVYIQDSRYQNILFPAAFNWALIRTTNGSDNQAAVRVFDHKRPQTANHALLQLNTGYWVVENQTAAPTLQTQLNNINTIIGVNNPGGTVSFTDIPAPNIKMIANADGQIGGFTIPNFPDSHAQVNIVALLQTATPADTVHAASAHASGANPAQGAAEFVTYNGGRGGIILPANNAEQVEIFNFDFKTLAEWTIEDATTGDITTPPGIVNFTSANSGRNLFVQYVPLSHPVTFDLDGGTVNGVGDPITHNINDGTQIGTANVPVPSRANHNFTGWQEVDSSGNPIDSALTHEQVAALMVYDPRIFVAQWTPSGGGSNGGGNGGGGTTTPPTIIRDEEPPRDMFSPYHNAYLIGTPDGNIHPNANITRAEVVTIFFRLLDDNYRADVWSQSNAFPDVSLHNWFNNAISTMSSAGIINGMPDGTFKPNDAITRAEFAAIVARFFDDQGFNQSAFTDIDGHWAQDYINTLASLGWVQGAGDGTFNPNAQITRAEAAAIVNRMLDRLLRSTDDLIDGRHRWPDKTNTNAWYYLYLQEATHSTEFERVEDGIHLRWVEILSHLDWSVLERPDSRPGDIVTERALQHRTTT